MYSLVQNYEITKEKYDELVELKNTDSIKFFTQMRKIADSSHFPSNAYGFDIPIKVFKEGEKYYASWSRWSSCD